MVNFLSGGNDPDAEDEPFQRVGQHEGGLSQVRADQHSAAPPAALGRVRANCRSGRALSAPRQLLRAKNGLPRVLDAAWLPVRWASAQLGQTQPRPTSSVVGRGAEPPAPSCTVRSACQRRQRLTAQCVRVAGRLHDQEAMANLRHHAASATFHAQFQDLLSSHCALRAAITNGRSQRLSGRSKEIIIRSAAPAQAMI